MKRISTLIFVLSFVLLSGMTFGQGRVGHGPVGAPETRAADHDRDVNPGKSHSSSETQEGPKDTNFEARIERNTALRTKVEAMLPPGTDLKTAAMGFRSRGQFLATLHVSQNVPGITFDQLKAKMTGSNPMTLGQAIHALKPNLSERDADKEADKAEKQAKADVKTTSAKPIS